MTTKLSPRDFFLAHAGYGYQPDQETKEQGRQRCAAALVKAEQWATDNGCSFAWEIDDGTPWQLWGCLLRDQDGEVLQSLWGIDFGRDGEPWDQPYRRVVEAELALEAMDE